MSDVYLVPWATIYEWQDVRAKLLSSEMADIIRAYEIILMWKLRCNNLSAYVECTAGILQVLIYEQKLLMENSDEIPLNQENNLRLSYSTAVIRFVNHVLSVDFVKGDSLYSAAKAKNIPDWMINLRHDAAHGQDLPSLDALHEGAELALNWVLENYWINEASNMSDLIPNNKELSHGNDTYNKDIKTFLKKWISLWRKCCKNVNFKYLHHTPLELLQDFEELHNNYLMENFIPSNFLKNLEEIISLWKNHTTAKEEQINLKKTLKVKKVIKLLIENLDKMMKNTSMRSDLLIEATLESGFLEDEKKEVWVEILHIIQHVGALDELLKSLFSLLGSGEENAGNWLLVLEPSIRSLKNKWIIFKHLKRKSSLHQTEILKKATKIDKEEYLGLKIPLEMKKPPVIDLELMRGALMNPGEQIKVVLKYLKFVKLVDSFSTLDKVARLLKIHSSKVQSQEENLNASNVIYSINDLMRSNKEVTEENNDVWKKSNIDINTWNKCPIGLLPHKRLVDCNLTSNIRWEVEIPALQSRKRKTPLSSHLTNMKKSRPNIILED